VRTIILAGGYAKRLWPITLNIPKPLLPVAGKPIIEYILDKYPFKDEPIISTNRRFAVAFERWRKEYPKEVKVVVEETSTEEEKLGTVGALLFLIKELNIREDLLILGGDNIIEFDLEGFVSVYKGNPLIALYDIKDKEKAKAKYGVAILDEYGRISDFQEKAGEPQSTLVSTACFIYPPQVFPLLEEFLSQAKAGKDAVGYFHEWLLKRKITIDAFVFEEGWYDIGDRASYIEANMHYMDGDIYQGKNVTIRDSIVRRSVIFDNVTIANSVIEDCVIDRNTEIGGLHLRKCLVGEGTVIRMA